MLEAEEEDLEEGGGYRLAVLLIGEAVWLSDV